MIYQKLFSLQEDTLKVLANQKRLEIVQLLRGRELAVGEIMEMLGLSQANLSQHLALLRQARIVATRREGVKIYYTLTDERIAEACGLIKEFLKNQYRGDFEISQILAADRTDPYPIVKDPVCGMRLGLTEAGGQETFAGQTFYFCASGCQDKFRQHPQHYITTGDAR